MKNFLYYPLFALLLLLIPITSQAVVVPTTAVAPTSSLIDFDTETIINSDKKQIEKQLGRKLKLKEKIALKFIKRKLKKNPSLTSESALNEVRTDGFAIAGFVLGIVGLFVAGLILGVLAIIFSAIALSKIKNNPDTKRGRGFAIAGLIMGIVGIVLTALLLILALAFIL